MSSSLTASLASQVVPVRPASSRTFVFDKGFGASQGLRFQFSRQVPSVTPEGGRVAPNEPRYAPASTLAGAPLFEVIRQTDAYMSVLGAGLDHDGVTPLMVTYETRAGVAYLDVFVGAGDAVVHAEQTGAGRIRTTLPVPVDLMGGAMPGKRYHVTSATVCHGLIVVFCTVIAFDPKSQSWLDSANAFVVSQDQGRTWNLVYESEPFQPGPTRGSPWTMQNWWPMERNVAPTDAFFAATDYCNNPGSPGGRLYLMRARRAHVGAPWTLEPAVVAMQGQGRAGEHFHVGGVLPLPNSGIRAFLSTGDGRANNRIISLISRDGSYTKGKWEVIDDYHGAAAKTPKDRGIEANQFIGCAPGPFEHTILAGTDLSSEHIMLLTMEPGSIHPRTERLVGFPCVDMSYFTSFIIRTPTPERGGPYVANAEPFSFLTIPFAKRALYSPDGIRWAQAAATGGYPVLHGGHIYFDGSNGEGLVRTPVPQLVTRRPLLVGPGGLQHVKADPVLIAEPPKRIEALTRDVQGRWIDAGRPLDPQPPTLGPVYRVQTSENAPSPWVGRIYACGPTDPMNAILGDHLQMRVWVRSLDPSRSGTLSIGLGDIGNNPVVYRNWSVACTDDWIPVTLASPVALTPGAPFQFSIRCMGEVCNDQTMYVALDSVQEGAGVPGYPMPPDTSIPPRGTAYPDEHASVTGFACAKAWTITLALQIAEDGFDFRAQTQTRWPLATIWGDNQNFIELFADSARGHVEARITSRGVASRTLASEPTTMVRGSPILVSVAQLPSPAGIELTASVGGRGVSTASMSGPLLSSVGLAVPPREVRFWSQTSLPSSSGRGVRTSPLAVWGGRIDEGRALSRTEREQLLRSLSFLATPPQ